MKEMCQDNQLSSQHQILAVQKKKFDEEPVLGT